MVATKKSVREIETEIAEAIVDAALAAGHAVSVYDGGEWAVKKSSDKAAILAGMFSTDSDVLYIRNAAGVKIAWVTLIYGNGGWDVMADWSDNEVSNDLFKNALAISDKYADS